MHAGATLAALADGTSDNARPSRLVCGPATLGGRL